MTMKATLHRAISPAATPARLPPLFRPLIDPKKLGAAPVTLAVFPATSAAVVSTVSARRLLAWLGDVPAPLVVVGYNFTSRRTPLRFCRMLALYSSLRPTSGGRTPAGRRFVSGEPGRGGRGSAGAIGVNAGCLPSGSSLPLMVGLLELPHLY